MEPGTWCMSWRTVQGEDYYEELFLGPRYTKLAEFMRDIAQKGEHCTRTVFGPGASYFSISPGGYSWQNLPPALENDIIGRIKTGTPTTVALGVHGSFVTLYSNGNVSFDVAQHYPAVDAIIRNSAEATRRKGIAFVALSPYAAGQYYVAYGDGSASWNIPNEWAVDVTTVSRSLRPVGSTRAGSSVGGFGGIPAGGGTTAAGGPASPSVLSTGLHAAGKLWHTYQDSQQNSGPQTSFFDTSGGSAGGGFDPSTLANGFDPSTLVQGLDPANVVNGIAAMFGNN
ncbi:hypothetical protein C8R45DRAFT_940347 [Mycena sanguinolenta]|nr:hypothetical protein C8R45DRAFT_940347 [Mycena sanguinolenta]